MDPSPQHKPNDPPASSARSASDPLDVEAILSGDRRAFEHLVRKESPRLFRVIVRIIRDDDEAQSIMQETFLQAYQRLDTFRGDAKLTTWIYAIGINQARAALRKKRRTNPMEEADMERLQPSFNKGMYAEPPKEWDPQKMAERSERQRLVREAVDQLPENYRTVVILRDLEELSTAEAADILGISDGATRVRLHRARKALRSILASHFEDRAT